jgi:hypothetical protein
MGGNDLVETVRIEEKAMTALENFVRKRQNSSHTVAPILALFLSLEAAPIRTTSGCVISHVM